MQIQPSLAAGGAAGSVSQASSKDRASGTAPSEAASLPIQTAIEQIARSQESSPDRDAEGAMYGQSGQGKHSQPDAEPAEGQPYRPSGLPVKPPEPPSQLDLLG